MKSIISRLNIPIIWLLLVGIIGYGYMKIDNLSIQLAVEQKSVITLSDNLENVTRFHKATIDEISSNLKEQIQITNTLSDKYYKNSQALHKLSKTFTQSSNEQPRKLETIATVKPTLLQRKINDATKTVGRKIENATTHSSDIPD